MVRWWVLVVHCGHIFFSLSLFLFFSFFLFFLPFPFRVTTTRTWLRNSKSTCKKEKGEQKIQHYMVDQIYLAISVIGVSLPLFISLVFFFFFFSQEENKAHHCKVILD
jgi:hypothetical protein